MVIMASFVLLIPLHNTFKNNFYVLTSSTDIKSKVLD